MVDAPVSGGTAAAEAGTLTFMVGGPDEAFEKARPLLEVMGKNVFHAGGAGNGQKTCGPLRTMYGICTLASGLTIPLIGRQTE